MPKYLIEKGVPKNVTVEKDPPVRELHQALGGSDALAGSPAGSEAKPQPEAHGFQPGYDG